MQDHSVVILRKKVQRSLILKCWKVYEDVRRQFNKKLLWVTALASQMNWTVCRQVGSESECGEKAETVSKFQIR